MIPNYFKSTEYEGDPAAHPTTLMLIRAMGHTSLAALFLICFIWTLETGNDPDSPASKLWMPIFAHFAGGRAGNAAVGIQNGFPPWFLFLQSSLTDLIIMFYIYPLFVSSFQRASHWRLIGAKLIASRDFALKYKDKIKPYGVAGLLIFVMIPIWSTGPLVGVIVGYMLRLGTVLSFTAVIIGNTISVALYVWAYDWIHEEHPTLAMAILIGIFSIACIAIFMTQKAKRDARKLKEHMDKELSKEKNVIDVKSSEAIDTAK